MIVHAYFDETGLNAQDLVLRWVGLIATGQFWGNFSRSWADVLMENPAVPYWHTNSAHTNKLPSAVTWKPIPWDDLKAKEERLCQLLAWHKNKLAAIEVYMNKADHAAIVPGHIVDTAMTKFLAPGLVGSLERDTLIMIRHAISAAAAYAKNWASIRPNDEEDPLKVWVAFEDNESLAELQDELCFAMQVLRTLTVHNQRKILGPVVFLDSSGPNASLPLQAADLFAWHVRKADACVPPEHWRILKAVPHNRVPITPERLQSYVEAANRSERVTLL